MAHVAPGNGGEVATAAHGRGRTLRAARLCRLRRCGVGLRWPSGAELLRLAAAFAGELLEARPYVVADQRAGRLLQLLGHHRRRCRQRSEEHTSELQSLLRISYAVFCL